MAQSNLNRIVPSRYTYANISSQHRKPGESATDFTVNFNNMQWSQDRMFELAIKAVGIPHEFYNVWEGANSIVFVSAFAGAPGEWLITVPPGYYTEAQLITVLQDLIVAETGVTTCTITVDSLTSIWTMECDVAWTFTNTPTLSTRSTFWRTIGWTKVDNSSLKVVQTFGGRAMLNRPQQIHVHMDIVEDQTLDSDKKLTELAEIVNMGETEYGGYVMQRANIANFVRFQYPEVRHFDEIRIYLTDQYDVPLSLPENFDTHYYVQLGLDNV